MSPCGDGPIETAIETGVYSLTGESGLISTMKISELQQYSKEELSEVISLMTENVDAETKIIDERTNQLLEQIFNKSSREKSKNASNILNLFFYTKVFC